MIVNYCFAVFNPFACHNSSNEDRSAVIFLADYHLQHSVFDELLGQVFNVVPVVSVVVTELLFAEFRAEFVCVFNPAIIGLIEHPALKHVQILII